MVGNYILRIRDKHIAYKINIKRKYTQIVGNSATGKTFLNKLLIEYTFEVINDSNVKVISLANGMDVNTIKYNSNCVFLVDENYYGILTNYFMQELSNSDNYFVFFTREHLYKLPISIYEVYELNLVKIDSFNTNVNLLYTRFIDNPVKFIDNKYDLIITEDSKSGFQFFNRYFKDVDCISAKGNSNVYMMLLQNLNKYKDIAIIIDSASFAPYMEDILNIIEHYSNKVHIYTPESFEWLLLKANILNKVDEDVLNNAENYCDDKVFIEKFNPEFNFDSLQSWERLFTAYLTYITFNDKITKYKKDHLNNYYLKNAEAILKNLV